MMISTQKLLEDSLIVQGQGNIVSDMDGEKVMLNIEKGKYYNLGELGGSIWDLMKEPITFDQLVTELLTQYDVDNEVCVDQVTDFLTQLNDEGLMKIVDNRNS
ncbi:lasso peptide biosynthesis PqqD family chaperone [Peribacillus simplex]|uniref:Lasso peptide biosynthesis PqqD family chaperone n=2 Tax=Peribacillus TaxID=2675229 RepID=A0AA90T504_9BACI|nr:MULTISPECIES: lasso peptide biosynthesis PqqD family chaperone [Peribacillus]MDP1417462.1 lasso peptide biosynthesis PqqD family chaperone [Peribacillus simplex]MDP1450117.1 lasso peptide biosynthesis PqqD family chaperone [Peribacillus frigoritolerans]